MAAIRDVEVDAIEAARKSVIELTLAHQTTARVARKQAVKELFGTLLASWGHLRKRKIKHAKAKQCHFIQSERVHHHCPGIEYRVP